MNRMVTLAAAGVLAVWATTAQAQQKVPGQGQSGAFGQQQSPYSGPITQNPWFSNPQVRQQLNFNNEQYTQLQKAYTNAWNQYQQGLNNFEKTLTPEQRNQRMQELQQNFYKNYGTATNSILTDPEARARYNQLQLQYRGYDAFYDPMVQEKLALTPEQRQKVAQYNQEWTKSMQELGRDYATNPEKASQRFNEMRKRDLGRLEQLLTPQQRQTWAQLTGNPYNFQPNVYFQTPATTTPK